MFVRFVVSARNESYPWTFGTRRFVVATSMCSCQEARSSYLTRLLDNETLASVANQVKTR